ncbi:MULTISPECIES: hypothetical protein [unclassified Plantactinospora]|jgi:predicted secreted protein|uniref:hypothetical protein n=1 Tax=unclassified Plantactinospora TaxID=2631981 RepID=UPI002980FF73|nr:hypothetical protein [Plantactinospora sp. KLBMP9567]MDW5328458.1 hypothetical protein [Plantactinospora sp. KLBMP9567]
MIYMALAAMMYVCGFVFLYGVVRFAVRHAIEDVELQRERAAQAPERDRLRERTLVPDNAFLAGS